MPFLICFLCDKEFYRKPAIVGKKKNFCSKECFDKWWDNSPEWLAEIRKNNTHGQITEQGYRRLYIDGKRIFEHRYVMEQHLGRPLTDEEVVHHINKDILDNRIENLEIMTRTEHNILHNTGKTRKGQKMPSMAQETKQKISKAHLGRKNSLEARKKMSGSQKKRWQNRKSNQETTSESNANV